MPDGSRCCIPTLKEFAPRAMDDARANRQKPSTIAAKQNVFDVHLIPQLGHKRLDEITNNDIQLLKSRLQDRAPKTVNNILVVLSWIFRTAEKLGVIERMPCAISLLPVPPSKLRFYDFEEYERLLAELGKESHQAYAVGLLGGEAGLRRGEMAALEWDDVDLDKGQICVQRSVWDGHVSAPKGGRLRYVGMTDRLNVALRKHRHLRSRRVFCTSQGEPLTPKMIADYVRRAARRGQLVETGAHILRHAFCSHLTMLGAPARSIQELAGHQDIRTTQRYMHLSPAARDSAIRLLEQGKAMRLRGNSVATATEP